MTELEVKFTLKFGGQAPPAGYQAELIVKLNDLIGKHYDYSALIESLSIARITKEKINAD